MTDTLTVDVAPDADVPTLDLSDASGTEDTAIPLSITTASTDVDGSETVAVTISGVPSGATLEGATDNGDGTWTVTDFANLSITPAEDMSGTFDLTVTSTATDGTDTESVTDTLTVDVAPDADVPTLDLTDASGTEDTAIPLSITTASTDVDGSESVQVTISGVPTGATLRAPRTTATAPGR